MAQETNYYLLLGLFNPNDDLAGTADDDPAVMSRIDKAISDRQRDWSKDSRNPRLASEANYKLDLVKHAKQSLDTQDKRRAAFAEARAALEKEVRGRVKVYAAKGYMLSGEIKKISEQISKKRHCTIDENMVKALIPAGVEIKAQEDGPKGTELVKPKSFAKYSGSEARMKPYGYANLYDMLDHGNTKIKSTPTSVWQSKAKAAKQALPHKSDTKVSDHEKMYNLCIGTAFKDDAARAEYDEYLAYKTLISILEEVKEATSVIGKLQSGPAEQYIDRLYEAAAKSGKPISRDQAAGYLLWYCGKNSIPYMPPAAPADPSTQRQLCPWCGALVAPNAVACSSCGEKILVRCPKCNENNRADVHYCGKCGYDYTNLTRASSMCDEAKSLAGALRFDDADQMVAQAETLWPGLSSAASVKQAIAQQRTLIGPAATQLSEAVDNLNLVAAGKLYDDIKRRSPRFDNPQLRETIDAGIARAKTAMESGGGIAKVLEAYKACHDYPGLAAALATNPPKAVSSVMVRADGATHRAFVSWTASDSTDISYVLLRKRGGRPLDEHDGDMLTETAATSYVDESIGCAEPYCYAVVVKLGPLSSTVTASEPVIAYFDVTDAKVSPSQSTIQITWGGVPGTGILEAWRRTDHAPQHPGDGERVSNVVSSGLLDQNLKNNVPYYYTIFVGYKGLDGKIAYSQGVSCEGIPASPPEPIDFLMAQLQPDGSFTLEWEVPEGGDARFYYTTGTVTLREGDVAAEQELESVSMPLQIQATGEDSGTFSLPDDSIYHIISATVKNGQAVIGACATVSSKRAVEIKDIAASGASATVMFDWPQESDRVLLAWRTDRYPASAEERGTATKSVNKKTYDLRKAIVVEGLQPRVTYYFSLFARLGSGDSASYSAGSNRTFSFGKATQATYRIEVKKAFGFGKITGGTLIVESSGPLPEMELRAQMSALPVFVTQGLLIASVPPIAEAGTHRIALPHGSLNKGMYYKLFFKDANAYQTSTLVQATGTTPEIG